MSVEADPRLYQTLLVANAIVICRLVPNILWRVVMRKYIYAGLMTMSVLAITPSFAQNPDIVAEQLEQAVKHSDYQTISQMLDHGFDINGLIKGDGTLLIMAVRAGNEVLVNQLIAAGADVNLAAENDGNPLIMAAMSNRLTLAKRLLAEGAEINAMVENDETPLINASRQGHFEMVKLLVEQGADINLGVYINNMGVQRYRSPLNGAKTDEIRDYLLVMGAKAKT